LYITAQLNLHIKLHRLHISFACICLHTGIACHQQTARAASSRWLKLHVTSKIAARVASPHESEAAYLWREW